MNLMMLYKFIIDKESLKKEFYSEERSPHREWFFHQYKGSKRIMVQEEFYKFLNKVNLNIPFFDWFHAYTIKNNVEYPFQMNDRTTNVITIWHLREDKTIQSEFPPDSPFKLNSKTDNLVMASPFKTKLEGEPINPGDIKNLIEQSNYTNKYLQALGKNLGKKQITDFSNQASTSSSSFVEKPLFKPFKMSKQIKKELQDSNPKLKMKEEFKDELLDLVNAKLKLYNTVIPDTPQTTPAKSINMIGSHSQSDREEDPEININPVITGPRLNWKKQTKLYYPRATAPDLLLEENDSNFKSFSANNVYEWNIDGQNEYNITKLLQNMTMVATAYETSNNCPETVIVEILVAGFSGQLKGWWDNYLTEAEKSAVLAAIKTDSDGNPILNGSDTIPDAVNSLIFTIAQHFIGDPSLIKDRSGELLSNLKCKSLGDFRWYKDTFLTRVYTRDDSHQPFWKEKFLAGLPKSLGDKVREKLRSQNPSGDIPYEQLSYGQLIAYIQKVALKICQDDKIQQQLAKEKSQNRKDLGTFCEQFGLPPCTKKPKSKPKPSLPKPNFYKNSRNKSYNKSYKKFNSEPNKQPETGFPFSNIPKKSRSGTGCYNCGKQGHISKYCRLRGKIKALNLDQDVEDRISNLLIESSEEESHKEPSEDLNQIQNDDLPEEDSESSSQINVLTKEQDLLFEAINAITDPQEKKFYLEKLKSTLEAKPTKSPLVTNKFNLKDTFKRLEKATIKPVTIQDLQQEINNLKIEIKDLK